MTPHSAVVGFVRTSCRGGSRALKKMNEEGGGGGGGGGGGRQHAASFIG